ncbi:MAG TPA: His/Gly/Thr/Pro-type tRNA ligase C-terminal domain-containing protein, partial [Actinomycetota bacterium]|nr:His/Gly/Thr/Pro-type tRNA ligase C-terminal domain-containing protein [Actinomycetota bacterium]
RIHQLCSRDGGPLLVRYDLRRVHDAVRPADLATRPLSLWRYLELLPLEDQPVTLGETMTPLLRVPRLANALGLELLAVKDEGLDPPEEPGLRAFIVGLGTGRPAASALLRDLRAAGVASDAAYEERPLKAQLRMADRAGAAYAAIVGEREAAASVVTLRRLADGTQEEVATADVVNWLTRRDPRTE